MRPTPRPILPRLGSLLLFLGLSIALGLSHPAPAQAAIHTYLETDTQTIYRSQHSVRDDRDQAWQAIFFKRQEGDQVTALHLRLVGFPGMGYPSQSRDLQVVTGPERVWEFPNVSDQEPSLTENASQFDLSTFIQTEDRDLPLKLYLPIRNVRHPSVLTVPPFMVEEWHQVARLPDGLFPEDAFPEDLLAEEFLEDELLSRMLFPQDHFSQNRLVADTPAPDPRTAERTPTPNADHYPV
ncbi:MAG: DUF3122 domain-containing protein [Prochlorothrix sp.]|nr:DUF3122 domain-containing protein [Prochlorothrix sp.]